MSLVICGTRKYSAAKRFHEAVADVEKPNDKANRTILANLLMESGTGRKCSEELAARLKGPALLSSIHAMKMAARV